MPVKSSQIIFDEKWDKVSIVGLSEHGMMPLMSNNYEHNTDEELMLGYKNGDLTAFECLYQRHKAAVYRFILRHGIESVLAEELLQDIWSSIIKNRTRYEPKAKFSTYLFQIARNRLIDHYRVHKEHIQLLEDEPEQISSDDEHRGKLIDEGIRKIHALIHKLPFPQRQAFLLHYEAGLTVSEVAEITQEHSEAVKSKIRYAVQKLKRLLGVHDE